ncbi:MAG TPA: ROK family protein [Gemmataceae bacterium]|nr:ROK family protein [Gemmataceae bacterium]
MNTLVIDIGGTNVKILATGQMQMRKIPSGKDMTPLRMVQAVKARSRGWQYDRVSIGFPAPVVHGELVKEPVNLGQGWVGFDFAKRFRKPVKLINDAAMQALGSYDGGTMLFLGLGTGLGSALIINHVVAPLELAHLPYRNRQTFEDYVGQRGLDRFGKQKWRRYVEDVTAQLRAALVADYIVLGGGNAKKLKVLPPHCRLGDNSNAFLGGFRLWEKH